MSTPAPQNTTADQLAALARVHEYITQAEQEAARLILGGWCGDHREIHLTAYLGGALKEARGYAEDLDMHMSALAQSVGG